MPASTLVTPDRHSGERVRPLSVQPSVKSLHAAGALGLLKLQRAVGNRAVAQLIVAQLISVQRCGAVPPGLCSCHNNGTDSSGNELIDGERAGAVVQRLAHPALGSDRSTGGAVERLQLGVQLTVGNRARTTLFAPGTVTRVGSNVQRQPQRGGTGKKAQVQERQNVVLLGEGQPMALARVLAPRGTRFMVLDLDDAAKQLAKVTTPIGVLYVVAHSTSGGQIKFGDKEGLVTATEIAEKLKGVLPPELAPKVVDFRACSLGKSPNAMKDIATAVGAKTGIAGDCFIVIASSDKHIKMGREGAMRDIVRPDDVTAGATGELVKTQRWSTFHELLRNSMAKSANNGKCIINPGANGYFEAGGTFVSVWFNPMFFGKWVDNQSVCYSEVAKAGPGAAHVRCRLVNIDLRSVADILKEKGATISIEKAPSR